uniref:Active regulator of SIRT1 n=1 Tax=Salvator merianae TaxID=96440 RepID=A0A8D0DRL5_SALMN
MSASLLKKGLELLETTGVSSNSRLKAARTVSQSNKKTRKKKFLGPKTGKPTVKGKITKSALEEYRKHQATDHYQKNMKYMMTSNFMADSTIVQKVLDQNRGRKARDRPKEKAKKKAEGTVFTEEDFQRFEKEYFGGAGKI